MWVLLYAVIAGLFYALYYGLLLTWWLLIGILQVLLWTARFITALIIGETDPGESSEPQISPRQ